MHIIGMLRLPTCPRLYVVQICGKYWTTARAAAIKPSIFAHVDRRLGYDMKNTALMMRTTRPWIRHNKATLTAVLQLGCLTAVMSERGEPRGKNTRKSSRLR
jgi:hypothetical protein